MKLLREFVSFQDIEVVSEAVEGSDKKDYYLKGPFLEANVKNRNGRKYMKETLDREVRDFFESKIKTHRSMGELDHPPEPTINLDRVSHIITDLSMDGNIGYGVAKIMNTPMGKIAKALVDDGVQLGMSTRGVGSLDGDMVKDDYKLITVDIVADPSAPSAFVEGILENKDYIIDECGGIVECAVAELQSQVDKQYRSHFNKEEFSKQTLSYLNDFLNSIHV